MQKYQQGETMKKQLLIFLFSVVFIISLGLIFSQTYLVEESLETSMSMFQSKVSQSMNEVFKEMDETNIKNYLLNKDKSSWQKYKELESISKRIKELRQNNCQLFIRHDSDEMMSVLASTKSLSKSDSNIIKLYHNLKTKRNNLLDSTFNIDDYAEYIINSAEDYNNLGLKYIDYKMLDTLIQKRLSENDINIKPCIGILDFSKTKLIYINNTDHVGNLFSSTYMYEYDFGGSNNENVIYVSLYFPSMQYFLKHHPYSFLIMSIVLVLLLIFVFSVLFKMIRNQQKVEEMKSNFISNMTHEIKTPISTISLACEMLDLPESKENNETINTYLRIISDENKRLKGLVELVLQQAKMTDKTIAFQKKEINIHEVITNAEENISFIMKRKGGNIQMDFQAKDPIIFADNLHITNLIYNLLDNAIKYSPKLLDVKISTYDSEKELHIVVSDKGIGIDKSKIKHIFDKFYRIPTGNIHNIKGFGIGLSYVKQIVDLHKGKINVTSEVNKGTTFDITIPRH